MATGGSSAPGSNVGRKESLTCSLCRNIFTQPKLLPSQHIVCLNCLDELTLHHTSPTSPCPQCRADVTVPEGETSAFQTNACIHFKDLDAARQGTQCLTHPKQDLDLYCVDCQLPLCIKCVMTQHKQHNTQDLSEAAREVNAQLREDEDRLQKAVSYITQEVEAEKKEQQAQQDKKAAIRTLIQNKHAIIIAMADKYRDELLTSLNTACDKMENEVTQNLNIQTNYLQELCHLQQRLQQARGNGTAYTQVTMAKEMREGKGTVEAIESMMPESRSSITRSVLNSTFSVDTLVQNVQDFFGTVDIVQIKQTAEELIEEKFTCREEKDTEVYCVCPLDNGEVVVSYTNCGLQKNVASDTFLECGKRTVTAERSFGNASWKCRSTGRNLFLKPEESKMNTYSKSVSHSSSHLRLCNKGDGTAHIMREKVISEDPFIKESSTEFTIKVGAHRAFDVDTSDQLFAVVEESQVSDQPRKVKLYQRNGVYPTATYASPSKPFNPSDVCFFTLGGVEVLLIADETGDSIHVVQVKYCIKPFLIFRALIDTMTFMRYLAPGCPLLVQPTALNTDHTGRLWVACRGGRILTISPITT